MDLNSYMCKDIMRMSGENRTIAMAILQGYALGKKGAVTYDANELNTVSNTFIEHCLDHPSDKGLNAFMKLAK